MLGYRLSDKFYDILDRKYTGAIKFDDFIATCLQLQVNKVFNSFNLRISII